MPTRVYFPSSGAAPVTPADWEFGEQVNPVTLEGKLFPSGTAMTTKTEATGIVSPIFRGMLRYVIGPIKAVTLNGTVRGQIGGSENNAAANATPAIAIKFIQPNGTDRGILLAPAASDAAAAPWEFATALTNSRFTNANEVFAIPLTQQVAQDGDYLVIEIGFRSATTTTRNISLRYGDAAASDLPEDTASQTDLNPWLEFSSNFELQAALPGALEFQILSASICSGGEHIALTTNLGDFPIRSSELFASAPEGFSQNKAAAFANLRNLYYAGRAKGMTHVQARNSVIGPKVYL